MSTEPAGAESNFVPKCYVNFQLERSDWCSFEGHCPIDSIVVHKDLCDHCQYKRVFNIPKILKAKINDKGMKNSLHCKTIQ